MDTQKNCELLFEYMKGILYDSKTDSLDVNELSEPFRDLGQGLQ